MRVSIDASAVEKGPGKALGVGFVLGWLRLLKDIPRLSEDAHYP